MTVVVTLANGDFVLDMKSTYTPGIVGRWLITVPTTSTTRNFIVKVTGVKEQNNSLTSTFRITAATNAPVVPAGATAMNLQIPSGCYRYFQTTVRLPVDRFDLRVTNFAVSDMTGNTSAKKLQVFVSSSIDVPTEVNNSWKNTDLAAVKSVSAKGASPMAKMCVTMRFVEL